MARKGKTYRTSSGNTVDFGALLLANETAPALGNMNVNARGDEIDSAGNITKTREQIMREYNELHTMVPTDDIIPEGTQRAVPDDDWQDWEPPVPSTVEEDPIVEEPMQSDVVDMQRQVSEPEQVPLGLQIEQQHADGQKEDKVPSGGLAAAVAAAKKVDPNKNVEQSRHTQQRDAKGVRRI